MSSPGWSVRATGSGPGGTPDLHPGDRPTVVAFGGGHGLSSSLTALRRVTDRLTAVVTVADNGGSSGRLRRELHCLPPGDLRMALAALCGDDESGRLWAEVLQYRFSSDGDLSGHAIGNLLIAGLWERLGDPVAGLDMVGRLLGAAGRVLPMSSVPLDIEADVIGYHLSAPDEAARIRGQAEIAGSGAEVRTVRLIPTDPPACPESIAAVFEADWVVLGPGSWFTSVIPHLLVPDLADAIVGTPARRLLTLNLEQDRETEGFTAARHIELLAEHAPKLRLDVVLADARFAQADPHLAGFVESLGAQLVVADVAARDGSPRHDAYRLAAAYADIMAG
ncbi:MAG: gluconeogenesis factor YvcK family protein [Propionibacteriaceae bacterium]